MMCTWFQLSRLRLRTVGRASNSNPFGHGFPWDAAAGFSPPKVSSTTLFCRADPGNVLRLSNTLHGLWGLCYFRNAKQSGLELRHPDFFFSSKTDEDNFSLEAWAASFIFPRSRFPRKCWFQKQVKLLLRRLKFLVGAIDVWHIIYLLLKYSEDTRVSPEAELPIQHTRAAAPATGGAKTLHPSSSHGV